MTALFSATPTAPLSGGRLLRALPYAGLTALVAMSLAACGGGSSTTSPPVAAATPAPTGTAGGGAGGGQGQRVPGTTGLVAAVNGSTMQVQTRTDQTAVSWSGTTTFTKQVAGSLADVKTGTCVTVLEPAASGSSATATPGAAPTAVTAATVQVRPATNGQCAGGFAGAPGGGGGAAPTGAPTRTGGTAGANGANGANGFGRGAVNGTVTAVDGASFTVQEEMRAGRGAGGATAATGTTGTATARTMVTVTVTTTGATTYLTEASAAASDVVVGECATALGKADDTGSVAATAISLRPATNGSCTGGGGRGNGTATGTATGSANG